jgi:hypothetical protein
LKAVALLVALCLVLSGCTRPLYANGREYKPYGLLNADERRSEKVCYEVSAGNVIWGIVLFETIVGPIYFFGFDFQNPVRMKKGPDDGCGPDD